jgi:polyhydroxyalkanoate synthesis regulator phasin
MGMAEPDTSGQESIAEALRRYVDAVASSTETQRERAGKLVGDLAKRGESRAKDIQKAARELADRSARDRRDLMRLIQKEIKRQVEALGLANRLDLDRLTKRIDQLEGKDASKAPVKKKKPST